MQCEYIVVHTCVEATDYDVYLVFACSFAQQVGSGMYVAMRRSLYITRKDGSTQLRSDSKDPLNEDILDHLITIHTSPDEARVAAALLSLGAPFPMSDNPVGMFRAITRYAVVMLGPQASALWRQRVYRHVPWPFLV